MADIIITQDPTKPGVNKLNGPTLVGGKIPLSNLDPTGAANGDVVTLSGGVWTAQAGGGDTASNLGAGSGVFSSKVGNDFQFKSLVAGSNITLTPSGTEIAISTTAGPALLTKTFTSTDQLITSNASLTLAHGMATNPLIAQIIIKNVIAQLGYSINDEVLQYTGMGDVGSQYGVIVRYDATNLYIRYPNSSNFGVVDLGTGIVNTITQANWRFIIRVFA